MMNDIEIENMRDYDLDQFSVDIKQKYDNTSSTKITRTCATHFNHSSPLLSSRNQYFLPDNINKKKYDSVLAIAVTCFNEPSGELKITLNDLYIQHHVLTDAGIRLDFHICIIIDGWSHASSSMKQYLKQIFPIDTETTIETNSSVNSVNNWQDYVNEWDFSNCNGSTEFVIDTLILQRREYIINTNQNKIVKSSLQYTPIDTSTVYRKNIIFEKIPSVKLTCIIKRDNRKKHNSHEWFLQSFAAIYSLPIKSVYNSAWMRFIFMTDCGTRFQKSCMLMLLEELLKDHLIVACTGIGRIMSYSQQSSGENDFELETGLLRKREGILASMYRSAQGYDYEAYAVSFSPSYALAGMLPVIPGPCGLFRYDLLIDDSVETHKKRLDEELIRITRNSILQFREMQITNIKSIQFNIISFLDEKIKAFDQAKKWTFIESQYATECGSPLSYSPKNVSPLAPSSPRNIQNSANNSPRISIILPKNGNEQDNLSQGMTIQEAMARLNRKPSITNINSSILSNTKNAMDITQEELYHKTSDILSLISSNQILFEEKSALLCCYLIYLIEHELYIEKIDDDFLKIFKKFVLRLTAEFDKINEQINHFNVIATELKSTKDSFGVSSRLYEHSVSFCNNQIKQFELFNGFKNLLLNLICQGDKLLYDKIEEKIKYRMTASSDIKLAIEAKQCDNELRNSRDPLEFYFNCVNKNPQEAGILLGSLLLTEDRILSYVAVLRSNSPKKTRTSFVQDAIFYCQAETKTENFMAQRRRWINGSIAGCIWVTSMLWNNLFVNRITKKQNGNYLMYFMLMIQLIQYLVTALIPAIFGLSLKYIGSYIYGSNYNGWLNWIYFGFYTLFVYMHSMPNKNGVRLHLWLYQIMTIINTWLLIFLFYIIYDFTNHTDFTHCAANDYENNNTYSNYLDIFVCYSVDYLILLVIVFPYLIALLTDILFFIPNILFYSKKTSQNVLCVSLHKPGIKCENCNYGKNYNIHYISTSFLNSIWNFSTFVRLVRFSIEFYLLLPTLAMMLSVYSFCRTWELTWGNRPSSMTIWNKSKKEMEQIKANIFTQSYFVTGTIWATNMIFYLMGIQFNVTTILIVVFSYAIFGWSLFQMTISLIIILFKLISGPFRICFRVCRVRANRLNNIELSETESREESEENDENQYDIEEKNTINTTILSYDCNNMGFQPDTYKHHHVRKNSQLIILEDKLNRVNKYV